MITAENLEISGTKLVHCFGKIEKVIIPDGVTEICKGAFSSHEYVKEIVIPDTVTVIEEKAFACCGNLIKINIPDSVISIGERAFIDCGMLKEIKLGKNVEQIGAYAFRRCSNLDNVVLPEKVTAISEGLFKDCIRLSSVELGSNVITIGPFAFEECDIDSLELGDKLVSIGERAFKNSSLFCLDIPESVKTVGSKIFEGCEVHKVECYASSKPAGWSGDWADGCEEEVFIVWDCANTNGVVDKFDRARIYIEGSVVTGCDKDIEEAVLPEGVTRIGEKAFEGCNKLKKITLPKSLKCFDEGAFSGCKCIITVNYNGTLDDWFKIAFYDFECNPLQYALEFYADCKLVEEIIVPDNIERVSQYIFQCKHIKFKRLVIPDSVKIIGYRAFCDCTFDKIELGKGIEVIEACAFAYGMGLDRNLIFGKSLKVIEEYAFSLCGEIESITLPRSAKVDEDAFQNVYTEMEIKYLD